MIDDAKREGMKPTRNYLSRQALELFLARRMTEIELKEFMEKLEGNLFELLPTGDLKRVKEIS